MEGSSSEASHEGTVVSESAAQLEATVRKAKIDDVWQQMNKGASQKSLKRILENRSPNTSKTPIKSAVQKSSTGWMNYLGLGSTKAPSPGKGVSEKRASISQNGSSEEAKKLAAAALSAVKDAAAASATTGKGKVEVTEVRDFAGEEIEVRKLVDAASKEAVEKGKSAAGSTSAVDAVLEQIKKKPKLSVLDKTKMDWGEFKEENKGMEDELDAYKKSSNKYLDRVSFLERTDYREFEREREVRLASQARRKTDMRDD